MENVGIGFNIFRFPFSIFHLISDALLTIAYPQACRICGDGVENSADGIVCQSCWRTSTIFSGAETLCAKCGKFLRDEPTDFKTFCRVCDDDFYDAARAVGIYRAALAASIVHLKRKPFVAKRLQKNFLLKFENSDFQDATLIVPVPLSQKRLLERGFNQAAVLAGILAKKTNLPLDDKSLLRSVHTPMHRVAMDAKAREKTVEDVFQIKRANFVKDQTILLVDDVFTSGATVSACAKILKENGARKVYVLTVARAG